MKKQILTITFFVMAMVFAGMNKSYGQVGAAKPYTTVPSSAPVCLTPQPLSGCTADELHPVQGETYTYTVSTTNATDDVRWFVVNNNDLSTPDSLVSETGGVLPSTNGNIDPADGNGTYIKELGPTFGNYNVDPVNGDASGTDKSIEIAWKYFDGTQPNEVLLVAYVEGDDACTNNIAVYRIIPQPAFTIDIAAINDVGDSIAGPLDPVVGECVSPIESAIYSSIDNTTPNGSLTVDYGENWVYFIVNGANYIDSWMPEFQISYADGTEPAVEASWAYAGDAADATSTNWNDLSGSLGGTWTSTNPVIAGATAASPGTVGTGAVPADGGECIVIRVRLDWGTDIEHDQATGTLTFAANGIAYDGDDTAGTFFDDTAFADLHHANCTADGFDNDVVDYEITPRPQVDEGTPEQEDKTGEGDN